MNCVEPALHVGARLVVLAKDQPEYTPLPASVDAEGLVMTEWEPTADELERLFRGGRIRLWTWTFGHRFQPVMLQVTELPVEPTSPGTCE